MKSENRFRFRKFKVYIDARTFALLVKKLCREKFPKEEQFALLSQIFRALDSILLNIAEGSDRGTDKDFALFLNRSLTSLNEVVACMDVALDMQYISSDEHKQILDAAEELGDQLTAFRKRLLAAPTK